MDPETIRTIISEGLTGARVDVDGDGHHFQAVIVSPDFEGKTPIARQRMVNELLKAHIDSGALHAISMRTLTPEQWTGENG